VDPTLLLEGIRAVAAGRRFVTPRLAEVLVQGLTGDPGLAAQEVLSAREFEVLRLLGMGLPTGEVAERLHISPETVGTYRSRIYEKLNLRGMAQLIRFAVESGLTRSDNN
jgi:DNA-binding NarL/FixJ family response regulator